MNKTERIGALRERCTLQNYTTTRSGSGQETVTYGDEADIWCSVQYFLTRSGEEQLSNRKTAVGSVYFTIRKEYAIDTKKRILYNSEAYDILSVEVTPDQFYHIIEATKRA